MNPESPYGSFNSSSDLEQRPPDSFNEAALKLSAFQMIGSKPSKSRMGNGKDHEPKRVGHKPMTGHLVPLETRP